MYLFYSCWKTCLSTFKKAWNLFMLAKEYSDALIETKILDM